MNGVYFFILVFFNPFDLHIYYTNSLGQSSEMKN